jgi:hypothetical protein
MSPPGCSPRSMMSSAGGRDARRPPVEPDGTDDSDRQQDGDRDAGCAEAVTEHRRAGHGAIADAHDREIVVIQARMP